MQCKYMAVLICLFFICFVVCFFSFSYLRQGLGCLFVCLFKRLSVHANGN